MFPNKCCRPEPEDYPNQTCRGTCRFLFLLVLSITFALAVTHTIMTASPNILVIAITNLKEPKNHDFIARHVYNTSNLSEAERLDIVSCVCNTTALSWKEFTKFYILNENSTKWDIVYNESAPAIQLPMASDGNYSIYDLPNTTVRVQEPLISDTFCAIANLWPPDKV